MRRDGERLRDILEAGRRIAEYLAEGRERFDRDELVQVWVVHHIGIIGEAAAKLSSDLRSGHGEVPWADMVAMRNKLVHDYFGIDLDVVWNTASRDIPTLMRSIEGILDELDGESD